MIWEPVSEDAFAVAEAPMLSSLHGLVVYFIPENALEPFAALSLLSEEYWG